MISEDKVNNLLEGRKKNYIEDVKVLTEEYAIWRKEVGPDKVRELEMAAFLGSDNTLKFIKACIEHNDEEILKTLFLLAQLKLLESITTEGK